MKKKFVFEDVVLPRRVEVEDGGCAKIFTTEDERQERLFVRIQSWSEENLCHKEHPEFDSLIGKKIRVTVEVIE